MLKGTLGSKGAGEWSDILLVFIISACILSIVIKIPEIMSDILRMLKLASAEAISRDLASLITISGTAQDSVTITYEEEDETLLYDIEIKDRLVEVTGITVEFTAGSRLVLKSEDSPLSIGPGKTAVDPVGSFEDVRTFTIWKERIVTEDDVFDTYYILAE